ncbi:MAG TPA: polysaccharide deacetylase family protein [Kofleriaceae bacterium]|nr:polysaccharide deacetylase family protein [Kofleriaceae bacterium]
MHAATVARIAAFALLAGCHSDLADIDGIFYDGDGRQVHCGADLDDRAHNDEASIDGALDRAAERGEVVELYAHNPGTTVPVERIEHVLAGARERGLAFYTYRDFADGRAAGPGLALSFDDNFVHEWYALRDLFTAYGARVTFFISRYPKIYDEERAELHQLAADGHDVAAHTVLHLRAPDYVEDHGLAAYLRDEALPSIQLLRDDGFEITSFAYPFGARTSELDAALLEHVAVLRSVAFSYQGVVQSPCPR